MNVWTRERLREVPDDDGIANISSVVMNRLAKWRSFFAGWQLGTRSSEDGESKAVRNHRELSIFQRAELSALTGLLIEKGVFTAREFTEAMILEAQLLDAEYAETYPGFSAQDDGMHLQLPEAAETMRKLGFPP